MTPLKHTIAGLCSLFILATLSFTTTPLGSNYQHLYNERLHVYQENTAAFLQNLKNTNQVDTAAIISQIHALRAATKGMDFWLRYLEPLSYKHINGPLPVEWETEVFEKFEKPYRRTGAGLTLAELYLQETNFQKDSLQTLLQLTATAINVFANDSITSVLQSPDHFYFCNRLYLLNLAAIYTTGFENPCSERIIPELRLLIKETAVIYAAFNASYPEYALSANYQSLYQNMYQFATKQTEDFTQFDHYTFIREFVNPLYQLNQQLIRDYKLRSKSLVDYSLNNRNTSIFSKDLYFAQNTKGIYSRISDANIQQQIWELGKNLFFDPILSGNNQRSCAGCHKPDQFFTDTTVSTHLQFSRLAQLPRNTPSLLNSNFNHLLMQDGSKNTLLEQSHAVITNSLEMNCAEKDILKKVLSCASYKTQLTKLLPYTPQAPALSLEHITSALTTYYGSFSANASLFDKAMNQQQQLSTNQQKGFNLFMSKAQCATCHFVPYFNGVKPPYVGSEFEVIGVPSTTVCNQVSNDKGRFDVNPAPETLHAFRTGTLRNIAKTAPYMHNGVFKSLKEVIDFYDEGGAVGKGLSLPNQTLSSDSLHLTKTEKQQLLDFLNCLTEEIPVSQAPTELPKSKYKLLQTRKVGGLY